MSSLPCKKAHLPVFHIHKIVHVLSPVTVRANLKAHRTLQMSSIAKFSLYLMENHMCWAPMFPIVFFLMFNWPWSIIFRAYRATNIHILRELLTFLGSCTPSETPSRTPAIQMPACITASVQLSTWNQLSGDSTAGPSPCVFIHFLSRSSVCSPHPL